MAFVRGQFGIEYDPRQKEREPSGLGPVFAVVAAVALISLTWTVVHRIRAAASETVVVEEPAAAEKPVAAAASNEVQAAETVAEPIIERDEYARRPVKVRNLLMRLEEAEKRRDAELAVSTIETIRGLPGSPAADIDDALARRLGTLNLRRLLQDKNAQWVKEVTVKRGDSATRIAAENGATLESLGLLNGGSPVRVILGAKLHVMDHPRFSLVIHKRSRTADLTLNGKFFKRYDIQGDVRAKEGAYKLPEKRRRFWKDAGNPFWEKDRAELDALMPTGASVLISEM